MVPQRLEIALGGGGGFCSMRQRGYYAVDKTLFIQHVLKAPYISMLIPRPRRFGKTFNITTLKDFLERPSSPQQAEYIRAGFEGSRIWDVASAREHFQQYPVLSFSFRACKGLRWEDAWSHIRFELVKMLSTHRVLLETPGVLLEEEKHWYQAGLKGSLGSSEYGAMLAVLSAALFRLHGTPVVILIDEYDTPIHAALEQGYYPEAIAFFKAFLTQGFKDNPFLFKGVITGILRVSKENMFSELNNMGVYSFLNDTFSTDFGLTQEEVIQVLEDQGCPELLSGLEKMYNGYLFGQDPQVAIYNPWSTLSCIANPKHNLKAYWHGSGSPALLHTLVVKNGPLIHRELERFLDSQALDTLVTEHVDLTTLERSPVNLFSFMLFTGYLKATQVEPSGDDYKVRLTLVNQELHAILTSLYRKWLGQGDSGLSAEPLLKAILGGDAPLFQRRLESILLHNASFLDGATRKPENFYQGLMLGLLVMLKQDYEVISNLESGRGRADLLLLPRTPGKPGVAMELKVVKDGGSHLEALLAGLTQMQTQRYTARLEERQAWPIHVYAVAFDGKDVRVAQNTEREALELERAEQARATHGAPASTVPLLDGHIRLDLEDRVLPLLTPDAVLSLWLGAGFELGTLLPGEPLLRWRQLMSQCTTAQQLSLLARLLEREFPALKGDPIMDTLRRAGRTNA